MSVIADDVYEHVVVTGIGLTENEAIRNATKAAMQQVVGMVVVSDVVIKNNELIRDKILTQSNAYIKKFKTLKSYQQGRLYYIDASVGVELSMLTGKLRELNIAIKTLDTQFFSIATNKFNAAGDYEKLFDKIIIEPIKLGKKTHEIDVVKTEMLDFININKVYWMKQEDKDNVLEGDLKPFLILFSIRLNPEYLDSIEKFLKHSAKSENAFNKDSVNYVLIRQPISGAELPNVNFTRNLSNNYKTLRSYELSPINFNLYKQFLTKFKNDNTMYLTFNFLKEDEKTVYKKLSYYYQSGNLLICKNKCVSESDFSAAWLHLKKSEKKYLIASKLGSSLISGFPDFFSSTNNLEIIDNNMEMATFVYMSEEDVKQIKGVKIELKWLENEKK